MSTNRIGFSNDFVLKNEKIGIGTADPLQILHVQGNLLVALGTDTTKHITLKPYETNNGTLSWEGSAGQLFSITNNLTEGSVFSINDSSAVPIVDAEADGTLQLVPYGGQISIGKTEPEHTVDIRGDLKTEYLIATTAFSDNLTNVTTARLTGVLNPILTLPNTNGKKYVIHSIYASNIARVEQQTAGASATITGGVVTAVNLLTPGEGYTTPPNVYFDAGASGSGAIITAEVDSDGRIIRLNILNGGSGYVADDGNLLRIDAPPLTATEIGISGSFVDSSTSVESYFAFDVPIPVGGALDVLKQPQILNPNDIIKMQSYDADGSGLSDAADVFITYEEVDDTFYTGSVASLTTTANTTLLTAPSTNPLLVRSIRLTNTEFVGDYDVSIKVNDGSTTYYLVRNIIIPSFATVEICDTPRRIEANWSIEAELSVIGQDVNLASSIDIQVSAKKL